MASKEKYKVIEKRVKKKDKDGNEIKDNNGKFVYETIATKYRVDAEFVPSAIGEICDDFMDNYVEAHNEGAWFVSQLEMKEPKKVRVKQADGSFIEEEKMVPISFMTLRSNFAKKFFPNIVKSTSTNKETYIERMLKKYKK